MEYTISRIKVKPETYVVSTNEHSNSWSVSGDLTRVLSKVLKIDGLKQHKEHITISLEGNFDSESISTVRRVEDAYNIIQSLGKYDEPDFSSN
ncbi:MAG: hypothetical protein WAU65_02945 [Candidatus Nanoarchaeia archaeon]